MFPDFNQEHVAAASGGGFLGAIAAFFLGPFLVRSEVRQLRELIESKFDGIKELMDQHAGSDKEIHARIDQGIADARETARRAHERLDHMTGSGR